MRTLGYAILGLLAGRPRTGYEISRAMQRPLGYFWSARHSQIYPELAALESQGLLRSRVIPGPGPRDTRQYALTKLGKSMLVEWIDSPLNDEPAKSETMLRVWSMWLLSPDQARHLINAIREETVEALAATALEREGFSPGAGTTDLSDPEFGHWATLQWGIAKHEALLQWCEWLLKRLAENSDGAPTG